MSEMAINAADLPREFRSGLLRLRCAAVFAAVRGSSSPATLRWYAAAVCRRTSSTGTQLGTSPQSTDPAEEDLGPQGCSALSLAGSMTAGTRRNKKTDPDSLGPADRWEPQPVRASERQTNGARVAHLHKLPDQALRAPFRKIC